MAKVTYNTNFRSTAASLFNLHHDKLCPQKKCNEGTGSTGSANAFAKPEPTNFIL